MGKGAPLCVRPASSTGSAVIYHVRYRVFFCYNFFVFNLVYFITHFGYLTVLLGAMVEGETVVVLGGLAAHQGYLQLWPLIALAFVGAMIGDSFFFFLGRYHGGYLLEHFRWLRHLTFTPERLAGKNKAAIAFGLRFIYGFRHVIPISLGLTDLPTRTFLFWNGLGALIWSIGFVVGGYFFGDALQGFLGQLRQYEFRIIVIILLVLALVHLFYQLLQLVIRKFW